MAKRNINPDEWSKKLNLPYIKNNWYNYNFGCGWGNRHHNATVQNKPQEIKSHINNVNSTKFGQTLNLVLNDLIDEKWDDCHNIYAALIGFCLKFCKDDITYYVDKRKKKSDTSVRRCCENLHFPTWARKRLNIIFNKEMHFDDFLRSLHNDESVNFDLSAALMVYKLQGEKAIFSILIQIFNKYKHVAMNTVNLVPELPLIWTPKASNFVNGTVFPVVCTKFSNNFEWKDIGSGRFLFDEFNNVIDCASVGRYNVFNETLSNRLSFLGRSGAIADYVICWCWGDIVNAVGHYNNDVLVRHLGEGYDGWFRFGLGGQFVVWLEDGKAYSADNKRVFKLKLFSYPNEGRWMATATLGGERADDVFDEEVIWTKAEMYDWLELGQMCKNVLKNFTKIK